jgi:hypothetical protein
MPLIREHVRIDCVEVLKLAEAIAGPANMPSTGAPAEAAGDPARIATLDAVRQAVLQARPIPFTDQVSLPVRQAADLVDRLRRLGAP